MLPAGNSAAGLSFGGLLKVLFLLALAGVAMRMTILAMPPVIPLVHRELHMSETQVGLLVGLPLALFALAATVYLSALGKAGLKQTASLCLQKSHYAQKAVCALPGYEPIFTGPFFKEFVVRCPEDPKTINKRLWEAGLIGGYPLGDAYPELGNALLICVTEQRTKEDIDRLVAAL